MTTKTTQARIVESNRVDGRYGMTQCMMIVDHPVYGRILLAEGYGGEKTPAGGAYRYSHGSACQLLPTDTFEVLGVPHNDAFTILEVTLAGHCDERPMLEWSGEMVEETAETL